MQARHTVVILVLVALLAAAVAILVSSRGSTPAAAPDRPDPDAAGSEPEQAPEEKPSVFIPKASPAPLGGDALEAAAEMAANDAFKGPYAEILRHATKEVQGLFRQLVDVNAFLDGTGEPTWEKIEISAEVRDQLLALLEGESPQGRTLAALALSLAVLRPEDIEKIRNRFDLELAGMRTPESKNAVLSLSFALHTHGDRYGMQGLNRALRTGAGSDVKDFRNGAVLLLGLANDAESSALLRDLAAADPDRLVRKHAVLGLGRIGGDENRAALADVLAREDDLEVRAWSALSLGRATEPLVSEPALERALASDPAGEVRGAAALAISKAQADGTAETLLNAFLADDHEIARIGAIAGISRLEDPGAAMEFVEQEGTAFLTETATTSEERESRFYASGALGLLPPSEERTETLHRVAEKDKSGWVRTSAIDSIAKTEGEAAVPYLEELLSKEKSRRVKRAIRVELERLRPKEEKPAEESGTGAGTGD